MPTSRRTRLRIVVTAIFALLFAQWSVAAYVCPALAKGTTTAVATQSTAMPAGCADVGTIDDSERALCQGHCTADAGAIQLASLAALPVDSWSRWERALRLDVDRVPPVANALLARATSPPLTLLYCVSLT